MVDISMTNPLIQGIVIFLIVALVAFLMSNVVPKLASLLGLPKKKQETAGSAALVTFMVLAGIWGVAVASNMASVPNFLGFGAASVTLDAPPSGGATNVVVNEATTPQVTVTMKNLFDDSTTTENYLHRIYKNENGDVVNLGWTATASGTAQSAVPVGITERICGGMTSTSDFTGNYYAGCMDYTVGSGENFEEVLLGASDENAAGLGSTFLNRRGSASAESVTAGADDEVFIEYKAAQNEIYGNGFAEVDPTRVNVLTCDFNTTDFDNTGEWYAWIEEAPTYQTDSVEYEYLMKKKATSWQDMDLDEAPIPDVHSQTISGSNNITKAWYVPAIYDAKTTTVGIHYEADDTNAAATDTQCRLYSGNYYIDTTDNKRKFGVEDNTDTLVGQTAPEITTMDWT